MVHVCANVPFTVVRRESGDRQHQMSGCFCVATWTIHSQGSLPESVTMRGSRSVGAGARCELRDEVAPVLPWLRETTSRPLQRHALVLLGNLARSWKVRMLRLKLLFKTVSLEWPFSPFFLIWFTGQGWDALFHISVWMLFVPDNYQISYMPLELNSPCTKNWLDHAERTCFSFLLTRGANWTQRSLVSVPRQNLIFLSFCREKHLCWALYVPQGNNQFTHLGFSDSLIVRWRNDQKSSTRSCPL